MVIIRQQKLFLTLFGIIIILVVLHLWTRTILLSGVIADRPALSQLLERFNLDNETGVGTWYSQALLLISSVLTFIIAKDKFRARDKFRFHWAFLAALFLLASIDEGTAMHELLSKPVRSRLSIEGGIFAAGWVVPVMGILILLSIIYFRFLLNLPRRFQFLFTVSLAAMLIGSVGVEIGAGLIAENRLRETGEVVGSGFFNYLTIPLEEGLEMIGEVLFVIALIAYLKTIPQVAPHWKKLLGANS